MTVTDMDQADSGLPKAIAETVGPKGYSPASRISQQLGFLAELDRLKSVVRQSPLADRSRRENSAEHSWHLAMFALTLVEHAPATLLHGSVRVASGGELI